MRNSRRLFASSFSIAAVLAGTVVGAEPNKPADPQAKPKVTYDEHILPIFREYCLSCHNQNEAKSDLALDSFARTMSGGAGGEVVLPGDLESSRLYALTAHVETPKMPPNQDRIPDAKLDLLKRWILGGALEHSGSKAKIKPKVDLSLKATADNKPAGPPAMPEKFRRQPFVTSARPGSSTAIAASPWAPLVAVAGQKQVVVYNSDTAELLTILAFPEGVPHVLKFSRDGSVLLAGGGRGGASGKVVLFDVKTGNRITEIGDELDVVLAADVSNNLSLVALGGPKKMVRVYSVADGSLQFEMKKHTDWIQAMEFSPDGTLLATADRSGGLLIWESGNGREYQNLTGHTGGINDVSWRSDSKLLVSAAEDATLKVWTIDNGKMLKSWSANRGPQTVEFGSTGNIVSGGRDLRVKTWDVDGKPLGDSADRRDMVMDAVFNWDASRLIVGDWSGDCSILDAKTLKPIGSLSLNPLALGDRVAFLNQLLGERKKSLEGARAEAEAAAKALADAKAAAKAAQEKADFTLSELQRLEKDRKEAKAAAAMKARVKPTKEAAEKALAAIAGVEKTVAEKMAAVKLATEALATTEREAAQAAIDKAEFDKNGNKQASAAK